MGDKQIVGYTDRIAVVAGDSQQFMLSSETPRSVQLELVQLICGDLRARGAGFQETPQNSDLNGTYDLVHQPLNGGSYGVVDDLPPVSDAQVQLHFYPTLLARESDQTLVRSGDLVATIHNARLVVTAGGQRLDLSLPLKDRRWHSLDIRIASNRIWCELSIAPLGIAERAMVCAGERALADAVPVGGQLVLGAELLDGVQGQCFNGKLEDVRLTDHGGQRANVVAHWCVEHELASSTFCDFSGNGHDGRFYNHPVRGTAGRHWDATVHRPADAPSHYGAVHFHDDDLTDARWLPTCIWQVPADLPSGQYAVKVTADDQFEYVPFFVRPAAHHQKAKVAYLASTATYLAYANQRLTISGASATEALKGENDVYLRDHIEVGLSHYESHSDGSGVHYSSYLRPILNLKPRGGMWSFNADTNITAWLDHVGEPFDVVTDEDLHRDGAVLLANHQVVVTGTHPEYYSSQMQDAMQEFLAAGGRLMYMGGNGFYWKVAFDSNNPAVMEVRRAEGGTRAWIAESGDYFQSFDGELGGMWRRNGHPPNQLVGVGFAAQGFGAASYYRVTEAAADERVRFMFEGTSGDDVIGNYGSVEGGAAGQEIDRWDPAVGSPLHALVVASSEEHGAAMWRVIEELRASMPFLQGSSVRADMTFFETPAGGAVFSTGSIGYAGSLSHNGYANDIARITTNVLKRFADGQPFVYPEDP